MDDLPVTPGLVGGWRARSQFHSFCEVMIVREDDMRQDAARQAEDRIAGGVYGKGAVEEVTVPRTDVLSEIQREDPLDPAHERIDPQVLRDGGPVGGQGAVTTTGGTAGPASVRRVARQPERHRARSHRPRPATPPPAV